MNTERKKNEIKARRKARTRARIFGTASAPRLSVFRSNRESYVQLINDEEGITVASASTKELKGADRKKTKIEQSQLVGGLIAKAAGAAGITKAVFDRGAYRYHGRVAAIAAGARKGGLLI